MIVDDEPVSQDYIRALLPWQEEGFYLYPPVYNVREAKALLQSMPVHIVILDVFMPGEDGVTLSRYIAQHYPKAAMLAVSGHDDYDYVREILKNGAHDYILKHRLNAEVLLSALKGIREKILGKGESKQDNIRLRIESWLFSSGSCPFYPEDGRLAVTVSRIPMERALSDHTRSAIVPGIISLLESNAEMGISVVTLFRQPNFFVICTLFSEVVSERKIFNILSLHNQKNRNNIKLVYNMEYFTREYPLLAALALIPEHLRRLQEWLPFSASPLTSASNVDITLTLARKKIFIAALEEQDGAAVNSLLREIFMSMPPEDSSIKLSIAKDLYDILASAIRENGLTFTLDGYTLLDWIHDKTPEESESYFKELFRRVIGEMEEDPKDNSPYIRQAREYMIERYASDISLEEVAAELKISASYLSRLYKKERGLAFFDELNRVRINAAKACLRDGRNLKETAALCGFRHYNYFFKVFKDYTGLTPTDFLRGLSFKTVSNDKIL
jgi:YesN/AraC family two-component response regulator